jgi:hypothetical protein
MRTITTVLAFLLYTGSAHAQARDTLQAIEHARRAAHEPIVGGYFLGGVVTGAASVVSVAALLTNEGEASPALAAGPVAAIVLTHRVRRSNLPLPAALEASLLGADPAYLDVFRRTYDETLQRRRARVAGAGVFAGIAGIVAFFYFGFRNYT